MKAVRFYGVHDVRIEDIEVPKPKGGEVLIKVAGAGVCHSDLHVIDHGIAGNNSPFTLGHENAGYVEEVGESVTGYKKGDAVMVYGPWGCGHCKPCQQTQENYCDHQSEMTFGGGLGENGGMAEYLLVPSDRLLIKLNTLDPKVAAPLSDAALTPYSAIKRSLHKITPDETVVVFGIGGLGHIAIQILTSMTSATIIACDVSNEKLEIAKKYGIKHTINSSDGKEAQQAILAITGVKKAKVVFDFVGIQPTLDIATKVVALDGDLTIVGLGGGTVPFNPANIPFGVNVSTPYWGSRIELIEVIALAEQGKIKVQTEFYKLDEALEVYEKLANGKIKGRAILVP